MADADTIKCASPTCRALVLVPVWFTPALQLHATGWRREPQPGDDRPLPCCPRCQL